MCTSNIIINDMSVQSIRAYKVVRNTEHSDAFESMTLKTQRAPQDHSKALLNEKQAVFGDIVTYLLGRRVDSPMPQTAGIYVYPNLVDAVRALYTVTHNTHGQPRIGLSSKNGFSILRGFVKANSNVLFGFDHAWSHGMAMRVSSFTPLCRVEDHVVETIMGWEMQRSRG